MWMPAIAEEEEQRWRGAAILAARCAMTPSDLGLTRGGPGGALRARGPMWFNRAFEGE